jgi:hypothetical protein
MNTTTAARTVAKLAKGDAFRVGSKSYLLTTEPMHFDGDSVTMLRVERITSSGFGAAEYVTLALKKRVTLI